MRLPSFGQGFLRAADGSFPIACVRYPETHQSLPCRWLYRFSRTQTRHLLHESVRATVHWYPIIENDCATGFAGVLLHRYWQADGDCSDNGAKGRRSLPVYCFSVGNLPQFSAEESAHLLPVNELCHGKQKSLLSSSLHFPDIFLQLRCVRHFPDNHFRFY